MTWNNTSLPLRYGFIAYEPSITRLDRVSKTPTDNVTVATKAQKKLRHIVLMLKLLVISYMGPQYSAGNMDATSTDLYREQNTSNRGTECDGNTRRTCCCQNLPHFP